MDEPTTPDGERPVIDDTPIEVRHRPDWAQGRTLFDVPSVLCPDCNHHLEPDAVSTFGEQPVWLLICPLEGTYWQYRVLP